MCSQPNSAPAAWGIEPPASDRTVRESRKRDDFVGRRSPSALEVIQLSSDPEFASHHIYPEAHMCAPDSSSFVFHRMSAAGEDTGHLWLCDMEDDFSLRRLTDEPGARGTAVSPDGEWMYYLADAARSADAAVMLKRVSLRDFHRETLLALDGPIPGAERRPARVYGLLSISSDGQRICAVAFLGDGQPDMPRFGLLVFELEKPSVICVFKGAEFSNLHPQYCRSTDPELSRDIMIQHNHGCACDRAGNFVRVSGGDGADLHVIRDDGTNWRDVPLGRDGENFSTGHEQWRGRTGAVYSAIIHVPTRAQHIYEATPIPTDETTSHQGFSAPGARFVNLTRNIPYARFNHFSGDPSGERLVLRNERERPDDDLEFFLASRLEGDTPELEVRYLLSPRTTPDSEKRRERGQMDKPRPFMSPDARTVFFHSNLDGPSHIFLARGYEW